MESSRSGWQVIRLARAAYAEVRAIRSLIRGEADPPPSLGSMTLDQDDVALAKKWLAVPKRWSDGAAVRDYEQAFESWNGSRVARAFMGGRVALSACIDALQLQPGDEVIVPGYTCVVVPNAFHYAGVKVLYCDIELETYGPDLVDLERKVTSRTRAVLIHHLYGLVCRDLDGILAWARARKLFVIEDCAHAAGASYRGRSVGNFGDIAFFSSEQSKVYTTMQGGLAVTNNPMLGARLASYQARAPLPEFERTQRLLEMVLLNYGLFKHPQRRVFAPIAELRYGRSRLVSTGPNELVGVRPVDYCCRMSAPLAAIGMNQLQKVKSYNERRRATASAWQDWCVTTGRHTPSVLPESEPVFLRYPTRVTANEKTNQEWAVKQLNVAPGVWFKSQLHPAPGLAGDCPNARQAVATCINLPCLMK